MNQQPAEAPKEVIEKQVEQHLMAVKQEEMIREGVIPAPPSLLLHKSGWLLRFLGGSLFGVFLAFLSIYVILLTLIFLF